MKIFKHTLITDLQLSVTDKAASTPVATALAKLVDAHENGKPVLEIFTGPPASAAGPSPTAHLAEATPGTAGYSDESSKVRDAEEARLRALYNSNEYIKNGDEMKAIDAMLDAWTELSKWDNTLSRGAIDKGELEWLLTHNDRDTPNAFNAATELIYGHPELYQKLMDMTPAGELTTGKLSGLKSSLRKEQERMQRDAKRGVPPSSGSSTTSTTPPANTNTNGSSNAGGTTTSNSGDTKGSDADGTTSGKELKALIDSPMAHKSDGQNVAERLGNAQDAISSRWDAISRKLEDPNLTAAERESANRKLQELSQSMTAIANMLQLFMTMQQNLSKMYNDIARAALNNIR